MNKQFGDIMDSDLSLTIFHEDLTLLDKPIKDVRKLAAKFNNMVDIYKVNISDNKELSRALRLRGLSYRIYSKGELIEHIAGEVSREELEEKLINQLQIHSHEKTKN